MKSKLHHFTLLSAAIGLLALTGCNTVSVSTDQALGVPTYPPNPDPASIEVLTKPPTREHTRLGEIHAEPSTDKVSAEKITQALRKAAAKLGADAVVVVYDHDRVLGAMVTGPWWGRSVETYSGRVIIGVAIKYK